MEEQPQQQSTPDEGTPAPTDNNASSSSEAKDAAQRKRDRRKKQKERQKQNKAAERAAGEKAEAKGEQKENGGHEKPAEVQPVELPANPVAAVLAKDLSKKRQKKQGNSMEHKFWDTQPVPKMGIIAAKH